MSADDFAEHYALGWVEHLRIRFAVGLILTDMAELDLKAGSPGRTRTYDRSINSRLLYH